MQQVLHTLKAVLEANDLPITYYDIALVPAADYADHSAFLADVLESGLTPPTKSYKKHPAAPYKRRLRGFLLCCRGRCLHDRGRMTSIPPLRINS